MPEQLQVVAFIWEVVQGPLLGTRFVGGYFPGPDGDPLLRQENGRIYLLPHNPLRLDSPNATFFGVEESIFRRVVSIARGAREDAGFTELRRFDRTEFFYSGFSVLRDGSALGPIEFFSPVEPVAL
jgi:hypothetical protein